MCECSYCVNMRMTAEFSVAVFITCVITIGWFL